MTFTAGHVTDIHLRNWSDLRFRDFIGKRLSGVANFQLKRRGDYKEIVLATALERMVEAKMDLLIVSGDLSNLGLRSEFEHAREFIEQYVPDCIPRIVIPGNHDRYTPDTTDGRFEAVFEDWIGTACTPDLDWPRYYVMGSWCFLLLDSSLPTPWFEAWGRIGDEQLQAVQDFVRRNPEGSENFAMVVHHHPSVALYKKRERKRNLRDAAALREFAAKCGVELILHGHNHYYDVRRMHEHPETVIFGLSSSITSKAGRPKESGQFALHSFSPAGVIESSVSSWTGEDFSVIECIEPAEIRTESPAEIPAR